LKQEKQEEGDGNSFFLDDKSLNNSSRTMKQLPETRVVLASGNTFTQMLEERMGMENSDGKR
jgi:hypothetical protein